MVDLAGQLTNPALRFTVALALYNTLKDAPPRPYRRRQKPQKQVRLTAEQIQAMAADYQAGKTVA